MFVILPCYLVNIIYYPHLTALSYRLEGKKSMRKHTKIKWNLRDFNNKDEEERSMA